MDISIGDEIINENIFMVTLIGPIIETLLVVFAYELIFKFVKNKIIVAVIVSTLFGIMHSYNIIYVIATALIGFIYIYSGFIYSAKKLNSITIMLIEHIIYNTLTILIFNIINFLQKG